MKHSVWFDFHDTIVYSSKAWLKAYKYYCSKKTYHQIKKMYKQGISRKTLASLLNVDYSLIEDRYRKNLKNRKIITWLLNYCIDNFDVLIISNASRKRILNDLDKVKINYSKIKLYTKEDGFKPRDKYIDNIIKANKFEKVIMIGNDKYEDNLKHTKITNILVGNIFLDIFAVLLVLYKNGNKKRRIL